MEIKNITEYNADYHKDGTLVWKKIGEKTGKSGKGIRKKKNYTTVKINDIKIVNDYQIDEDILRQSREQYNQTKELIPVLLSFEGNLIGGFEQYELAKELGRSYIPAKRITKLNKAEEAKFRRAVANEKIGNKKYLVKATDGSKIFVSLNVFKKVKQAIYTTQKCKCTLEILPNFTFRARKNDEYIIGSSENGVKLSTYQKKIEKLRNSK